MRRGIEKFYEKVRKYKEANPGLSLRKIGKKFDVSHETIRQIVKEHGNNGTK